MVKLVNKRTVLSAQFVECTVLKWLKSKTEFCAPTEDFDIFLYCTYARFCHYDLEVPRQSLRYVVQFNIQGSKLCQSGSYRTAFP